MAGCEVKASGRIHKKTLRIITQKLDSISNFRTRSNFSGMRK